MTVVEIDDPSARSRLCETVLADLSDWFGFPDVNAAYVTAVAQLPTLAVGDDAFLSLKLHNPRAAEVYVLGVRRDQDRRGLGSAPMTAAEEYLRERPVEYLQVKTLGPSYPDEGYERTRRFYEACGFVPLEEIHDLWDTDNPCLLMVKRL